MVDTVGGTVRVGCGGEEWGTDRGTKGRGTKGLSLFLPGYSFSRNGKTFFLEKRVRGCKDAASTTVPILYFFYLRSFLIKF